MGKLNIGKSFRNKKFKYGGYAALLTTIVIAVVVAINLVVGQFNLKLDLTKNKMFTLSDQSVNIVKGLKSDVKITGLYEAGKENTMVKELLNKYKSKSNRLTVDYVDPVTHPQFTKQFAKPGESISEGSIIVQSGSKFRVISGQDLVNYSMDQQTFQQTPESLAAEQKITGAIMYVTSSKNPVVYALQGHNEEELPADISKTMETENFTVNKLDLVSGEWKYAEGDMLVIDSPKRDISPDELKKLTDFMSKGGRTVVLMDYTTTEMPNLQKLLNAYGVNVQRAAIVEGEAANMIQNPLILIPNKKNHDILNPLISGNLPVIIPQAQPIEEVKVKKSSLTIEPLLSTSDKAYAKKDAVNAKTVEKEAGDIAGPFNIAVAITDKIDESNPDKTAKMVVISSSLLLDSNFTQASNGGNIDFFMNSLNWMSDKKDNVSIRPISLATEPLNINMAQGLIMSGLAVIVIPLAVAVTGVMVWLRRRHL